MTIHTALRQACRLFEGAGVSPPRLTAEVLLGHVLGCERAYLYAHSDESLSQRAEERYLASVRQRLEGKPTQYITGAQEFYGRPFEVTPDVLIPRPETEHVVEEALRLAAPAMRIADVGCGSGAIAVTLSIETGAPVWATDISLPALRVAARNAARLGGRVHLAACDLTAAFASCSLDLIVSNPPYVPLSSGPGLQREVRDYEPRIALFAGETGLEAYQRLIGEAERVLRAGGALVMELGFSASGSVRRMLGPRWGEVNLSPDLAGIPRVISARLR